MPCFPLNITPRKSHFATLLSLAAFAFAAAANPALANPFNDARDNIVEGRVADAMMILSIGAASANERDEEDYTLLHYAARAGSLEAIRQLLERGADPQAKAKDGSTPVSLAKTVETRAMLSASKITVPGATPSQ